MAVVVLKPTGGFVVVRENSESVAAFGSLAGTRLLRVRSAPLASLLEAQRAAEEVMDTGRVVRFVAHAEPGIGAGRAHLTHTGEVLMTWKPLEGTPLVIPDAEPVIPDRRLVVARLTLHLLRRAGVLPGWTSPSPLPTPMDPAPVPVRRDG